MDLRWGYNNVCIKEEDKWKAVFTIPEELFEPTVMFFGLTNSPATFQTMMNKLLQDFINIGKVASFIDDVIIGIETEERHDEIVEEAVKWLVENNLYVKPEKYKWKVNEVGFLEVIIGLERIKIKEECQTYKVWMLVSLFNSLFFFSFFFYFSYMHLGLWLE